MLEILLEHGQGVLYRGPIYGGGDLVGGPGGHPGGGPLDRHPNIGGPINSVPIHGQEGLLEESILEEYIGGPMYRGAYIWGAYIGGGPPGGGRPSTKVSSLRSHSHRKEKGEEEEEK